MRCFRDRDRAREKIGKHESEESDAAAEPGRVHARVFGNGNGPDQQAEAVLQFPRKGPQPDLSRSAGVRGAAGLGSGGRDGRAERHGHHGGRGQELQSAEREQLPGNGQAVHAGLGEGVHQRVSAAARHRVGRGGPGRGGPVPAAVEKPRGPVGVLRQPVRRG